MKTGRLLKFRRDGAEVHAYFYQDDLTVKAAIYLRHLPDGPGHTAPDHEIEGATDEEVEAKVRAWVGAHLQ